MLEANSESGLIIFTQGRIQDFVKGWSSIKYPKTGHLLAKWVSCTLWNLSLYTPMVTSSRLPGLSNKRCHAGLCPSYGDIVIVLK